ncbi:MAG: HAMP domain-containing histidine kinase [Lachnospiraceae bacterium]|nr:HAMP domain-containing histidine kinase [Lachnospiraceae bacterium]
MTKDFRKLRKQMTLFSAIITGAILLALSAACLFFAESSNKRNSYASFLKESNTVILQLQSASAISHQWLNQLHNNSSFLIYLYDNGNPLYYQVLQNVNGEDSKNSLTDSVISYVKDTYYLDIFQNSNSLFPIHEEFTFQDTSGMSYYVSAGLVPKTGGTLSFLILFPLSHQQQQILSLHLFIGIADILCLLLLTVFAWIFSGKMLVPLVENKRKQTQFVAAASHELRTPLTVILSALEAAEKTDSPEKQQHFCKLMKEEGKRMQRLISDMLLLANSDSKHFQVQRKLCQPDEILLNVYEKYENPASDKQIGLQIALPPNEVPDCFCDMERIIQLLSILLDNALSYTPAGGKVKLSLTVTAHKKIRFYVADTGMGIPTEEKKHIFERFYRADSSHTKKEHFGLGLSIAKEIVDAHKGSIWVEDNVGRGTVFVVEI